MIRLFVQDRSCIKLDYALPIGTKIDDLGWPWTNITLTSNFQRISRISHIWEATKLLNEWR